MDLGPGSPPAPCSSPSPAASAWTPIIALLVAADIVFTGVWLVRRFAGVLMDRALRPDERAAIEEEREGTETP